MVYNVDNYDYEKLRYVPHQKRKRGQTNVNHKNKYYADMICAFDIETTRLPDFDQSIMYVWQFAIDIGGNVDIIMGRTWEEYARHLVNMDCAVKPDLSIMIFVHNLSYEWQYLRAVYDFDNSEVFAIKSRKILRATMYKKRFEYRCSYLLTNMSLDEATRKYKVKHGKLSGIDFDYSKIRYPWTPLTDAEIAYCVNDVYGLCEVLEIIFESEKDNYYSLPFTSTGYVRRDVKTASTKCRQQIKEMAMEKIDANGDKVPDVELYDALRAAFRGGNTHANRYYADKVLKDVQSYDRSSSYPDVLCNCEFPMDYFTHVPRKQCENWEYVQNLIYKRGKACLLLVRFKNIHLRDSSWGCPYIPRAKCDKLIGCLNDNGRVLLARSLETWVTDIDFKIINEEYTFTATCLDCYFTRYGKIPECYIKVIEDYYKAKTELKGVKGQEVFYMKSKNKLNSIYGMMATDPVRERVKFNGFDFDPDEDFDKEKELGKSNRKAFVVYAWGVWTTAHARNELEKGIKVAGIGFVYCDTDSVKFVGKASFDNINEEMKSRSVENGAFATDPKGVTHYMGVWECDEFYNYFKTMGAKKYAYVDNGKLSITIAGVPKRLGAAELLKYSNGDALEALHKCFIDGFTFSDIEKLEAVYNDKPELTLEIDGHNLEITPNTCLRPVTYTLGKTGEYQEILKLGKVDFERMCRQLHEAFS